MRILFVSLLLLTGACASDSEPQQIERDFRIDGTLDFVDTTGTVIHSIDIEIAETEDSRQQGLMHRRQMTLEEGMFFLFAEPDTLRFWMANTPIPLDILFVGADSQVVSIAKRTPPLSRENVVSKGLAQYVVEVRGGYTDRYGIDETTRIQWHRTP